jgi:hypothetical protein
MAKILNILKIELKNSLIKVGHIFKYETADFVYDSLRLDKNLTSWVRREEDRHFSMIFHGIAKTTLMMSF